MQRCFLGRLGVLVLAGGMLAGLTQVAHATTISGAITADNAFLAYISTDNTTLGTLVAQGSNWGQVYTFSNFALTAGQTYYLQIEGINQGSYGAVIGQFNLSDSNFEFSNLTQTLLTETTDWLGTYNDANSNATAAQAWVPATGSVVSDGVNGVGPWGNLVGISGSADWIDASSNGLSSCGNCTVDFSATITSLSVSGVPEPGTLTLVFGSGIAALGLRRRRAKA